MKLSKLLTWSVLLLLVSIIPTLAAEGDTPVTEVVKDATSDTFGPLLELLGGKGTWLTTIIAYVSGISLVLAPFAVWISNKLKDGLNQAAESADEDDDKWLAKLFGNPIYRFMAFLLNFANIRFPKLSELERAIKLQKEAAKEAVAVSGGKVGKVAGMLLLLCCLSFGSLTLTGCANSGIVKVAPNADPVVVHAEWLSENATYAIDEFLLWEWNNRATLQDRMPAVVESAKALRKDDNAKNQLLELRRLTREYKTNRNAANGNRLTLYTNTILSLVNSVRANMGLPAIVLPDVSPSPGAMVVSPHAA